MSKYPEDAELKERVGIFQEKYQHFPVFTKEVRRATSISLKQDEIKKMLNSSYTSERRLTGVYELDTSSEEACIKSYKELEKLIKLDKRIILLNSANQGIVLKYLKTTITNKGSFIKSLCDKEISISLSHCNFLIAFYELTEKYPQLVQGALELRFFTKHFKIVKEVAPEVCCSIDKKCCLKLVNPVSRK